jgi:hypothetical protein
LVRFGHIRLRRQALIILFSCVQYLFHCVIELSPNVSLLNAQGLQGRSKILLLQDWVRSIPVHCNVSPLSPAQIIIAHKKEGMLIIDRCKGYMVTDQRDTVHRSTHQPDKRVKPLQYMY